MKASLSSLPVEIQTMLLSHLAPKDIYRCRRINRHFHQLIDDEHNQRICVDHRVSRSQERLAAFVQRYCYFPVNTIEHGAPTALLRAALDYVRYHRVVLADIPTYGTSLHISYKTFLEYYRARYEGSPRREWIDPHFAIQWLHVLLLWHQSHEPVPSGPPAIHALLIANAAHCRASLIAHSEHVGFLTEAGCARLLTLVKRHPELFAHTTTSGHSQRSSSAAAAASSSSPPRSTASRWSALVFYLPPSATELFEELGLPHISPECPYRYGILMSGSDPSSSYIDPPRLDNTPIQGNFASISPNASAALFLRIRALLASNNNNNNRGEQRISVLEKAVMLEELDVHSTESCE